MKIFFVKAGGKLQKKKKTSSIATSLPLSLLFSN